MCETVKQWWHCCTCFFVAYINWRLPFMYIFCFLAAEEAVGDLWRAGLICSMLSRTRPCCVVSFF